MLETARITCLCGQVSQRVSPTQASKSISLCHCSSCRSTSGVLCTSYLSLDSPPDTSKCCLTEYAQSADVSRWFCAVCGAHAFAYARLADRYYVATGLLETTTTAAAAAIPSERTTGRRRVTHWGVRDTRDGGLSRFLQLGDDTSANGDVTTACLLGPTVAKLDNDNDDDDDDDDDDEENNKKEKDNGDIHTLQARCHCGGVSFAITRPDDIRSRSSSNVWSPWPDLLVPYHSTSLRDKNNPDDVKWWLRADNTKYLAGTCACTSCRLASGFPIQTWAFVPKTNIVDKKGAEFEYLSTSATLQCFESSPAVFREFCNVCGATVFWHCRERPGVVDVSVGMLRAQSGARAEDWVDWVTARVSFAEDAPDDPLIALLEEGLRAS